MQSSKFQIIIIMYFKSIIIMHCKPSKPQDDVSFSRIFGKRSYWKWALIDLVKLNYWRGLFYNMFSVWLEESVLFPFFTAGRKRGDILSKKPSKKNEHKTIKRHQDSGRIVNKRIGIKRHFFFQRNKKCFWKTILFPQQILMCQQTG